MVEKYSKYGEEFKLLLKQEQQKLQEKIFKIKTLNKELRIKFEQSENRANELETQSRSYVKEVDE